MSLTNTPASERIHIAFFGRTNSGKSSLINAITNQKVSIVSDVAGTTTDPVRKTMELLPIGPVLIIDTPGIDDESELGIHRVKKAKEVLWETDIAILVVDSAGGFGEYERELIDEFRQMGIPHIVALSKCDDIKNIYTNVSDSSYVKTSAIEGLGIDNLKNELKKIAENKISNRPIIKDLLCEKDIVMLVIPIDESAPKGRLILPQQLVIRELLDNGMIPILCKDTEIADSLLALENSPALVITDSQVFKKVSKLVSENIRLTSFSILMARHKGILDAALDGIEKLSELSDGDGVLICEGCTHHIQCGDIGTEKLPNMIREFTGINPEFHHSYGRDFDLENNNIKLIIHCGGCMLNEREVNSRFALAKRQGIPITNFGMVMAKAKGILERSTGFLMLDKSRLLE